jgi:hypothetical protein
MSRETGTARFKAYFLGEGPMYGGQIVIRYIFVKIELVISYRSAPRPVLPSVPVLSVTVDSLG